LSGHRRASIAVGVAALAVVMAPGPAAAAGLDGASFRWPWILPFVGLLLSIAIGPLLFPRLWHAHYGKIAFAWATLTMAPLAALRGIPGAVAALVHALLADYLSFIVLLFALYVVAGGILVIGNLRGTPWVNTAILALGTAIASVVGTTGAAMILIRPLLRANAARLVNAHVVVFFIFLVANIGGALSPLGDPPLFVGFLRGVDFFWTTQHLAIPTAIAAGLVLALFVVIDVWHYRRDRRIQLVSEPRAPVALKVKGIINIGLIALIVGAILMSAVWKSGVAFTVYGTVLALENLLRDAALVLIAFVSLWITPEEHRDVNGF
jgi:Na+/H+ antiporter NhaD/arsenite permease-like protein